jgi:outer membrane protein insertion porin family
MGIVPININQAESKVDLEYSLVEKANDQLEVSGGWGANRFVGTLGLKFSNFAISRMFDKGAWRPIPSGDGQTLSLKAQTNGTYYQSYSVSFVEPWLGGKKPNSFSVSLYHTIQSKSNYLYQSLGGYFKITGASISLGRRLKVPDDYFILSNSISFQKYNLHDYYDYFIINEGASNNFSFTTTFSRNSVSQPIYPRRGSKFSLSLQITPPYSSFKENKWWELSASDKATIDNNVIADHDTWTDYSDEEQQAYIDKAYADNISKSKYSWIEYHKWKFKSEWYLKLIDDLVIATKTEFGYLGYFNKDLGYSPFGSFDLGGDGMSGYSLYGIETISLRGYENSSLTPRTSSGQKNGNVYQKMNMELRYPISLKPQATIYVLGFVEAGNAWQSFDNYNPFSVKRSAGIGLRAFLPMFGLLGIDWGYGFDEIPGMPDANGGQFHFVIGQQF